MKALMIGTTVFAAVAAFGEWKPTPSPAECPTERWPSGETKDGR